MLRLGALLLFLSLQVSAAEKWIRVTTPNFELYTPVSVKAAKEKILYFEQVREFLNKSTGGNVQDSRIPVRIILFKTEAQYSPYRFNEFASAYYSSGLDRDYIAIGGEVKESERTAIHEYVHLVARHARLNFPPWLNEGMADLYSNLEPRKDKVLIGAPIPERLYVAREKLFPLSQLLEVNVKSPEYNRKSHAGTFYAQSWALTHMLQLDKDYHANFNEFLKLIADGLPSEAALEKAYNKPLKSIEQDLVQYIRHKNSYNAAVLPIKFEKAEVVPDVTLVNDVTAKAILASLHVSTNRMEHSQVILKELESHASQNATAAETVAYAYWRKGEPAQALPYFTQALAQTSNPHPKLLMDAARICQTQGKSDEGIHLLQQVLLKDPDWQEARIQLVEQLLSSRNPQKALEEIRHIKKVNPDIAARFFIAAAYTEAANHLIPQAKASASTAQKYAKDMWAKESISRLLEYLNRAELAIQTAASQPVPELQQALTQEIQERDDLEIERPRLVRRSVTGDERVIEVSREDEVQEAVGILTRIDCIDGKARLHISRSDRDAGEEVSKLVLAIYKPETVIVRGESGENGQFSLECGDQNRKIRVDYTLKTDAAFRTDGELKILEPLP